MSGNVSELLVPLVAPDIFDSMSDEDQATYLTLYREQVAPKFEEWRNAHRVKMAYGGRGAGAKSRSAANLLIQFGENPAYFGNSIRVLCVREVQKSIKESSWLLLKDTLDRLGYRGWECTNDKIINKKNGSYFIFNGLNDMTKDQLKSYESFDILFAEEAAPVSKEAWLSILATFRKPMSEIWGLFNRDLNMDPCYELFCMNPEPNYSIIKCAPGPIDNPWWFETTLQEEWTRLKKADPDEAANTYEGLPRVQGDRAVFSQSRVLAMFERKQEAIGVKSIGCDVARFGKDNTEAYKRHGHCVIAHEKRAGFDTVAVAGMLWDMAEHDKEIAINVDVGYNPGVIDMLASWGANVKAVGFGEVALRKDTYTNAATEMMFELPIDEISIPEEYKTQTLLEDLTERFYAYDTDGRKKLESKDGSVTSGDKIKSNFKGRHGGRSPDEGDALCLTFYDRVPNFFLM